MLLLTCLLTCLLQFLACLLNCLFPCYLALWSAFGTAKDLLITVFCSWSAFRTVCWSTVPVDLPIDLPADLPLDLPVDLPIDLPVDLPLDLSVTCWRVLTCLLTCLLTYMLTCLLIHLLHVDLCWSSYWTNCWPASWSICYMLTSFDLPVDPLTRCCWPAQSCVRSVASLPSDEYYTTVYSELPPTKRPQETGEGRPERKFVFYNTLIPQHVYNICTAPLPNTAKKRLSQYFLETDVFCTYLFANKLVMYEYIQ